MSAYNDMKRVLASIEPDSLPDYGLLRFWYYTAQDSIKHYEREPSAIWDCNFVLMLSMLGDIALEKRKAS